MAELVKTETRNISELHGWDKNPRSINKKDFERLKKQIQTLGQYKPLLITQDNEVIGGNMRLKAYTELGITDVWVSVVTPKNEQDKLEYALSDNDRAGYYDDDLLANLIPQYPDFDWASYAVDMRAPQTLDDLVLSLTPIDEDEAPEVSDDTPDSVPGQVYELGPHRLMCGSATSIEDVTKLMNGHKASMVFTDPPYNVAYTGKTKDKLTIQNDALAENFEQFLYDALSLMKMFVVGDVYVCMSSSELHTLFSAFVKAGGHWSTFLIWVKNHFTLGRSNYQRQYEPILYGWFEGSSHYWSGARDIGDVIKDSIKTDEAGQKWIKVEDTPTDVIEIDRPSASKQHPTMKPVELSARAIKNSSKANDIVLDLFGGSGSTLIACEQTKRVCYIMELDPRYCDVIRKRYANFTMK